MRLHARQIPLSNARVEFNALVAEVRKKYSLSESEYLLILVDELRRSIWIDVKIEWEEKDNQRVEEEEDRERDEKENERSGDADPGEESR